MRTRSRRSAVLQTECQNFDFGMIVGARQGGLSVSETADPLDRLGFSHTTVSGVCREWCKKKTYSELQSFRQKRVVNERGQKRRARLVKADRKVTVTQVTAHYSAVVKSISEYTTNQTPEWIGYSRRSLNTSKK